MPRLIPKATLAGFLLSVHERGGEKEIDATLNSLSASQLKQLVHQFLTPQEEEEIKAYLQSRKKPKKKKKAGLNPENQRLEQNLNSLSTKRQTTSRPISKYADELEYDFLIYQKPSKKGKATRTMN